MSRRLHVIAFPHTETTGEFLTCAYTAKARKAARMFSDAGHTVYLYAGEANDAPCYEHVPLVTRDERDHWFGRHDPNRMPDVGWSAADPWWRLFNARAILALAQRAEPRDLILLGTSWAQKPIVNAFPQLLAVEYGVGYEGIMLERCAFESYAWMHHVYGLRGIKDGRNYDRVIPNFFDLDEFPDLNDSGGDYLLFVGRVTPRKGVVEAWEIARASGMRLVVAGPRAGSRGEVDELPELDGVEYVGPVGAEERARLMAGARALLAPTRYVEPFGGVVVEAHLTGTPTITTDQGAFTETVVEGRNGFRIRSLAEGVAAVERAGDLNHLWIRANAIAHYSLEAVAPLYDRWFDQLDTLWDAGWYTLPENAIPSLAKEAR